MIVYNTKPEKETIVFQLLLVAIIIYLYSFSWGYPFYNKSDDYTYIVNNPYLTLSASNIFAFLRKPYYAMYTPLTMFSYMFDYNLWGLNSFGYHLQNIFWHIIATLTIYKYFLQKKNLSLIYSLF